jgi:hypothetical protein
MAMAMFALKVQHDKQVKICADLGWSVVTSSNFVVDKISRTVPADNALQIAAFLDTVAPTVSAKLGHGPFKQSLQFEDTATTTTEVSTICSNGVTSAGSSVTVWTCRGGTGPFGKTPEFKVRIEEAGASLFTVTIQIPRRWRCWNLRLATALAAVISSASLPSATSKPTPMPLANATVSHGTAVVAGIPVAVKLAPDWYVAFPEVTNMASIWNHSTPSTAIVKEE